MISSTSAAPAEGTEGKAQQAAALKLAREQRKNSARRAARAAAKEAAAATEIEAPADVEPADEPVVEEPAEAPVVEEPAEEPADEAEAPVEPEQPQQPPLLPEAPLTIESIEIPLDALPADDALVGPPPSRELVEAIRAVGILVPISVVARPTRRDVAGGYDVIAGRRRIKAARQIGLERIPAVVVETSDQGPLPDALTIQLQQQKQNPATELAAIERLVAQGYDESAISRATGLAVPAIRARLRFGRLVPDLRAAFEAGTISTHVAERSARLSVAQQEGLVETLHEKGRIISTDVHEANAARARASLASLDLDGMPDAGDLPDLDLAPLPTTSTPIDGRTNDLVAGATIAVDLLRDLLAVIDDAWQKAGADAAEQPDAAKRARLFLSEYDRA